MQRIRELYNIFPTAECRLWQRYNVLTTYELLKNPDQTLSDAGIYGGQVIFSFT